MDTAFHATPDLAQLLPRAAFYEIMMILRGALPAPVLDETALDKPGAWARRDRAAMAAVAALLPVTAAEGRLAAQFVATDTWAMDCLRLARERRAEPDIVFKCRAQAMGMMREGKSALRALRQLQAARRADGAVAPHPDAAHEGEGEGISAGAGSKSGIRSDCRIQVRNVAPETATRFRDLLTGTAGRLEEGRPGALPPCPIWDPAKGSPLETFHLFGSGGRAKRALATAE